MSEETDITVSVDPASITRILSDIKKFQPALSTGIRRQIRDAGKIVVADIADEIRSYPSSGKYGSRGMRAKLAKGLAVRMYTSTGAKKQGVQIVSTGKGLPASQQALVKAMNRATFQHRVWGRASLGSRASTTIRQRRAQKESNSPVAVATQKGMQYFRPQVVRKSESQVQALIAAALEEAAKAL